MGKVSFTVERCHILRGTDSSGPMINPRVHLTIDNTYRFHTHTKRNTYDPVFDEKFVVSNTHRMAIVEVEVYSVVQETFLTGITNLLNLRGPEEVSYKKSGNAGGHGRSETSGGGIIGGGGGADSPSGDGSVRHLVGRCYISLRRLVQGKTKRRTFALATTPEVTETIDFLSLKPLEGVAGTVTLSIESESLGESSAKFALNDSMEDLYMRRLLRLMLRYDPPRVAVLDVLMANVKDSSEERSDRASGRSLQTNDADNASSRAHLGDLPTGTMVDVVVGSAKLNFSEPATQESFVAFHARMCQQYGSSTEPEPYRVHVQINGCANLEKKAWNTSLIGSDSVYAVVRTQYEDLVTGPQTLQNTLLWSSENEGALSISSPENSSMHVILYGKNGNTHYEIGRCALHFASLAYDHTSQRNMFLFIFTNPLQPVVTGVIRLSLRPLNFGLTPLTAVTHVDEFYDRLAKFLRRYEPTLLPHLDRMISARLRNLEDFMQNLVVVHGCEPSKVRLTVTINSIDTLLESEEVELTERDVQVCITFGNVSVHTNSYTTQRFAAVKVGESFTFDVVRPTDMLRIDVVRASDESVVYGRVDFSCITIQKGALMKQKMYLVGCPGTLDAFFSGVIDVALYSDQIGKDYEIDTKSNQMAQDRLRRYVYRRIPETLHRVNLAAATVFDIESFLAQIARAYGEEDPTYAIFFTVTGCRRLRSRFGGVNPYVCVRVGIDSYQTKYIKDTVDPDFFEYCEFCIDRPGDQVIKLIVMDHSDIGHDDEIGEVTISLRDVIIGEPYQNFVPIVSTRTTKARDGSTGSGGTSSGAAKTRDIGSVGFKFTIMDLNMVDRVRTRLMRRSRSSRSSRRDSRPLPISGGASGAGTHGESLTMPPSRMNSALVVANDDAPSGKEEKHAGGGGGASMLMAGFGNRWSAWRKRVAQRAKASMAARPQHGRTGSGDVHSLGSTDGMMSDLDSFSSLNSSLHPAARPTLNLMDDHILGVDDFCTSQPVSRVPSRSNSDMEIGLDDAEDPDPSAAPARRASSSLVDTDNNKLLAVRVLYCRDVYAGRQPPNPYLMLSTLRETHFSQVAFGTTSPKYNEEFEFSISDPDVDELRIAVLTDTAYGPQKIGFCCLSVKTAQRDVARTRWVQLVMDSHMPTAFYQGSICVVMRGINFGLDYLPSDNTENRLREFVREHLYTKSRALLHNLELYVAELSLQESLNKSSIFIKQDKTDKSAPALPLAKEGLSEPTVVEAKIKKIDFLHANGMLLNEFSCVVKLKVQGKTCGKTKPTIGEKGRVVFSDDAFPLHIESPLSTTIRVYVQLTVSKEKLGECYLSLIDLHKGTPKERDYYLVLGHMTARPVVVGVITLSLKSDTFGSTAPPPTEEDESKFYRLNRYFYYYLVAELAVVDIKYATTLNVEAYIKRLVDTYGPEPGNYALKITVRRASNLNFTPKQDKKQSRSRRHRKGAADDNASHLNLFVIITDGLREWRTSAVKGSSDYIFFESFVVDIGLPQKEHVQLIVKNASGTYVEEVGRATIPLDTVVERQRKMVQLPLVNSTGSRQSAITGSIDVGLSTENFGQRAAAAAAAAAAASGFHNESIAEGNETPLLQMQQTVAFMYRPEEQEGAFSNEGGADTGGDISYSLQTVSGGSGAATVSTSRQASPAAQDRPTTAATLRVGSSPVHQTNDSVVSAADGASPRSIRAMAAGKSSGSEQRMASPLSPSSPTTKVDEITLAICGFQFVSPQERDIYIRVTDEKNTVLLKTKPVDAAQLALGTMEPVSFEKKKQPNVKLTAMRLSMKLGTSHLFNTTALCYVDFCLLHCERGATTRKQLRLYDMDNKFLGICFIDITLPRRRDTDEPRSAKVSRAILEVITDDLATLYRLYNKKDLRHLDSVVSRATDLRGIHRVLRQQLAPSVLATVYVAVQSVKLKPFIGAEVRPTTITAVVGDFAAAVDALPSGHADLLECGMLNPKVRNIPYPLLRIDISCKNEQVTLQLRVSHRKKKSLEDIGSAGASLRALLTPKVFDMGELITLPLVSVKTDNNTAFSTTVGSISFFLVPPADESYPSTVRYSGRIVNDLNRAYVRYYVQRMEDFLTDNDPNGLLHLHTTCYDDCVAKNNWKEGLPKYLESLVKRWGAEKRTPGPVPPLT